MNELEVCGLNISALARSRILGIRVASKADLAVLAELRRLGGLLKHVHNETRGAYSALTAQAIKDLSAYVRALTANRLDVSGDVGNEP
jgi:phosphate uptake regulator